MPPMPCNFLVDLLHSVIPTAPYQPQLLSDRPIHVQQISMIRPEIPQ
jgi:hypothetical protein